MDPLCWWEYDELVDHFNSRPDLWISDGTMWIRRMKDGEPAFALQLIPPQDNGPYRQYTPFVSLCGWDADYTDKYLKDLVYHWTSYSTRLEFQNLMVSELKLDPEIAGLMAIALMRATIDPHDDPERTYVDPPQQCPLWAHDLPPGHGERVVGRKLLPYPGGSIILTQHHGQCRVRFEIVTSRTPNGWHTICMTGWARPLGYTLKNFFKMMDQRQEPIDTDDPDSELPLELLEAGLTDRCDMHPDQPANCPVCKPMQVEYDKENEVNP